MGQGNAIYKFSIKLSLSSKAQNKSKYTYIDRNGSLMQLYKNCDVLFRQYNKGFNVHIQSKLI